MFRRVGHCASQLASGGDCWPGSGNVPCARGVGDSLVPWLAQVWRPAAGWGTASSGRVLWSVRPAHLLPRPQAVSVAGAPRRVLFVPLPRRRFSAVDAVVLAEVVVLSGAQKALSTSGAGAPGRLRRRSGVSLAPREVSPAEAPRRFLFVPLTRRSLLGVGGRGLHLGRRLLRRSQRSDLRRCRESLAPDSG